jgi:hypothetical protein
MANRLAASLQASQVAVAEVEAARVQSTVAVSEAQSSQAALLQATERLYQTDVEVVKLRAQTALLQQENASLSAELRCVIPQWGARVSS